MMAGIRGRDTKPELLLRHALHRQGMRFRLHRRDLPGRPDIVMPKARLAVFVHGCFWHRHPGCRKATTPKSNSKFWARKFSDNRSRDERNIDALVNLGWRVAIVWECALDSRVHAEDVASSIRNLVHSEGEVLFAEFG